MSCKNVVCRYRDGTVLSLLVRATCGHRVELRSKISGCLRVPLRPKRASIACCRKRREEVTTGAVARHAKKEQGGITRQPIAQPLVKNRQQLNRCRNLR